MMSLRAGRKRRQIFFWQTKGEMRGVLTFRSTPKVVWQKNGLANLSDDCGETL